MWMLLGLLGVVLASSMADAFLPADEAAIDEDPGQAPDTNDTGEDQGQVSGDMLDMFAEDGAFVDASLPGTGSVGASDGIPPSSAEDGSREAGDDARDDAGDDARDGAGDDAGDYGSGGDGSDALNALARDPSLLDEDAEPLNWLDGEYLSTDVPMPPPEGSEISLGDDGEQAAGGEGDDTITGGEGGDWIDGLGGEDSLIGGDGDDTILGGEGRDTLIGGSGNDSLSGGGGGGLIDGGSGNDSITGGADDDALFGGSGDDTLTGGWGDDLLVAGEGEDLLIGGAGDDTLFGYTPDDDGNDIDGADFLNGGDGDDYLVLGSGDIASGGVGADTFVLGNWVDPDAPAQITDFDANEDTLVVAYDAQGNPPEVTSSYDAEAGGLQVFVDGSLVAILPGVETLLPDAVSLMAVQGSSA